jgi:hypothetical protein
MSCFHFPGCVGFNLRVFRWFPTQAQALYCEAESRGGVMIMLIFILSQD